MPYVPLAADVLERKIEFLDKHFGTQRSKDWFDRETLAGLARLRDMECQAPSISPRLSRSEAVSHILSEKTHRETIEKSSGT
ncbi:hypothetical protein X759_31065 [Mesorhizobium sp. LSHC420B00]|nr:hypothetical protein X759_31065 [Mesorhizobium sp. LSHC420B00]